MSTWHQQQRPSKLYHETKWSLVSDMPNNCTSITLFDTEQEARERLALWEQNGVTHCYILRPASLAR
jgi:hypothetical protein